jgi:Tetraspanin family
MAGRAAYVARWYVIIINVLFILFGIGLIIAAAVGVARSDDLEGGDLEILNQLPVKTFSTIILVVGIIVVIIALSGLIGAWKRNRKLLTFYALFIFSLAIFQLSIGIALFLVQDDPTTLDRFVQDEWTPDNKDLVEKLQTRLECCGYKDPNDSRAFADCPNGYTTPCRDSIIKWLDDNFSGIAIACIIFACVELVSMIAACVVLCTKKEVRRDFEDPYFENESNRKL